MRIAYLQHVSFEGPGTLARWAEARGHELVAHRQFESAALPEPEVFDALVILGGPMGVHDEALHPWLASEKDCLRRWLAADKPVLGVCLGAQLLADVLGAAVSANPEREIGWFPIRRAAGAAQSWLGQVLPEELEVFHWHGDTFAIPAGARAIAASAACAHQAFLYGKAVVGLQFHLEMDAATARGLTEQEALTPGAFVQTAEEMLAAPARFERLRPYLFALMDRWAEQR